MQINIACALNGPDVPAGVTLASIVLTIKDGSGLELPAITLNGTESPPWSTMATVANGPGTAHAVQLDTTGAPFGSAQDQPYDFGSTAPAQKQLSGLSITQVAA